MNQAAEFLFSTARSVPGKVVCRCSGCLAWWLWDGPASTDRYCVFCMTPMVEVFQEADYDVTDVNN